MQLHFDGHKPVSVDKMCVSCQRNSIDVSFQIGYVSEKGGGKGCAYLLSVQTSRYSMCFSSIFYA